LCAAPCAGGAGGGAHPRRVPGPPLHPPWAQLTAKGNGAGSALAAVNTGLVFAVRAAPGAAGAAGAGLTARRAQVVLGGTPIVLGYSPSTTLGSAEFLRLLGKMTGISAGDSQDYDMSMAGLILCFVGVRFCDAFLIR
jgi:hypothetical protein